MANRERLRQLKNASKEQLISTILQQEDMIANATMVARNAEVVSQDKTKVALLGLLEKVVPICSSILKDDHKFTEEELADFRSKFFIGLRAKIAEIQTDEIVENKQKSTIILN